VSMNLSSTGHGLKMNGPPSRVATSFSNTPDQKHGMS
jgi:hypothetical protein